MILKPIIRDSKYTIVCDTKSLDTFRKGGCDELTFEAKAETIKKYVAGIEVENIEVEKWLKSYFESKTAGVQKMKKVKTRKREWRDKTAKQSSNEIFPCCT